MNIILDILRIEGFMQEIKLHNLINTSMYVSVTNYIFARAETSIIRYHCSHFTYQLCTFQSQIGRACSMSLSECA